MFDMDFGSEDIFNHIEVPMPPIDAGYDSLKPHIRNLKIGDSILLRYDYLKIDEQTQRRYKYKIHLICVYSRVTYGVTLSRFHSARGSRITRVS